MDSRKEWTIIDGPDDLGFYTAHNGKGKYAHVNKQGVPIYSQRFNDIAPFQEGVAVVQDGKFGYHIRPDGNAAYEKRYEGVAMPFENGRADVFAAEGNLMLVMDEEGRITEEQ